MEPVIPKGSIIITFAAMQKLKNATALWFQNRLLKTPLLVHNSLNIEISRTFSGSSVCQPAPPNATETNPCISGSSLSIYRQKSGTIVGPVYFNGGFAVLVWL